LKPAIVGVRWGLASPPKQSWPSDDGEVWWE
jgi:hypothetical protein